MTKHLPHYLLSLFLRYVVYVVDFKIERSNLQYYYILADI